MYISSCEPYLLTSLSFCWSSKINNAIVVFIDLCPNVGMQSVDYNACFVYFQCSDLLFFYIKNTLFFGLI